MADAQSTGNVWAVIHHVNRGGGDVSVASNRADDPAEWERAHHGALRNMHAAQKEAQRWSQIAGELADGQHKAAAARWGDALDQKHRETEGADA